LKRSLAPWLPARSRRPRAGSPSHSGRRESRRGRPPFRLASTSAHGIAQRRRSSVHCGSPIHGLDSRLSGWSIRAMWIREKGREMKRTGFLLATAMAFVMCLAVPALAADGSSLPNSPGGPGVSGSGGTAFTGGRLLRPSSQHRHALRTRSGSPQNRPPGPVLPCSGVFAPGSGNSLGDDPEQAPPDPGRQRRGERCLQIDVT